MPTVKHRINITLDNMLFLTLKTLADKNHRSLSSLSYELLQKAVEQEEDVYFSKQADERLSQKEKRISHKKAWE